jgi:hypothetical protein
MQSMQAMRVQPAGGQLLNYVQHESVLWFERLYRKLPVNGMYAATPSQPVSITMGAEHVPGSMVLIVLDYRFDIYRFSGAYPGEYVPVGNRRLSTQVGWDIAFSGNKRAGNFEFQLVPQVPLSAVQQSFATSINPSLGPQQPQQWEFDQARQLNSQSTVAAGLSLMPQRHHREGLMQVSNEYVLRSSDTLTFTCNVFNTIPIPIAFFEVNFTGILMQQALFDQFQLNGRPIAGLQGSPR